jgi:hypothetical protein
VGLILAIAAVIGVAFVFRFVDSERERDLRAWQIRLGIVADSRFAAVSEWVEEQYAHLTVLAENAALQIYMTELTLAGGDREQVTEEAAQAGYLRNLLVVAASRGRFTGRPTGPAVGANVQRVGVAGIALLDMTGRVIVSTPEMPPIEGALRPFVTTAPRGARALKSVHEGAAGTPTMAFIAPVFAVQGEVGASEQIGMVIGVKEIDQGLYPRLRQPGAAEATAETLLVRSTGTVVEYLSPLGDGTPALQRTVALSTDELAAAFAISTPGGFAIKRDYRDQEVLVTGRAFAIAPWTLVHKINRAEALADSDARLTRILAVFLLTIAVISAAILAVWWHGSSRRAQESAASYRGLAQRFESQGRFLQLVQPHDRAARRGRERRPDGQDAGRGVRIRRGQALPGPCQGRRRDGRARLCGRPHRRGRRDAGGPVRAHSVGPNRGSGRRDITAAVTERERRERIQRQLVQTLVAVVDRRDPYAANHSMRVGTVARAIAEEMDLEPIMVETVEIAGSLMNLGKILVPKEVLTKGESLSEEEIKQVRDSIQTSADLIEGIEFDGPVVETLRQLQERWDGAGVPLGLAGDEILITAQIVAVANAFVAMVSPRAYRPGSSFDEAVETLLSEIRKAFERRPVAALVNYLDSRRGRERWAHFTAPPAGT